MRNSITSTRVVRRSVRHAAVPLAALALVAGLAACDSGSGDDKKKADPTSAPVASDAGRSSDAPGAAPSAKSAKTPASVQELTAALLTAQEMPAGLTIGKTAPPDDSGSPTASDPKCQALLVPGKTSVASIKRVMTGGTDPGGVVVPDADIVLSSYRPEQLDTQWSAYVTAAKTCKTFTAEADGTKISSEVLEVRPDAYGPNSLALSMEVSIQGQSARFTKAVTRIGTTVSQVTVNTDVGVTTTPTLPARLVEGQNDKVRSRLGG